MFSLTDGIFLRLRSKTDIPWGSDSGLANKLDLMYIYNHSGDRYIAPILESPPGEMSTLYKDSVIDAVWSMYKNKWTRLWALNNVEYNPIENYSMTELHTGTDTGLKTPTNWKETTEHKVSQDYKETDSQKPTNWKETKDFKVSQDYKETESQKPTNWTEETEHSVSQDYKESDTQKPTNWIKTDQTAGTPEVNNNSATINDVIPFNGTDFAHTTKSVTVEARKTTSEQGGTFANEHTQTGTKTETKTQSGTFDTEKTQTGTRTEETSQSGTFDTEHTQTGTKTETKTQSGTFDTERTQTGSRTDERTQSGTFDTERTQTGTRTEETSHTGTFEDKMTYNSTLVRSGNVGVTTSQQMAQSEIELWKWLYFEDVFKDIDNILTLSTY